ncbi:hypothetical protein ABL78_7410 [Leptomonas seymouri]|uniref:Uncharacterized protein n=1 Tax=Leptomonas seymouri TaxID=5684 RepID=A0A0N1IH73_LEPSE|nr:hypothetical protein ABL78_7410 [Leptomonas seymouri]|eukprot:KPI83553.1 hypothetical protein ABL78_7410 [Leptomonas seymouri]
MGTTCLRSACAREADVTRVSGMRKRDITWCNEAQLYAITEDKAGEVAKLLQIACGGHIGQEEWAAHGHKKNGCEGAPLGEVMQIMQCYDPERVNYVLAFHLLFFIDLGMFIIRLTVASVALGPIHSTGGNAKDLCQYAAHGRLPEVCKGLAPDHRLECFGTLSPAPVVV